MPPPLYFSPLTFILRNVQLHDYLVELDMKHGGSKGIRAARLREGLFRLKSETLAGIYNGKPFDDMSEFELRYTGSYALC